MTTETTTTTTKECTCHKFIRLHDGNCAVHGFVRRQQPSHEQPASARVGELSVRDFDYHEYGDITLNETENGVTVAIAYMQGRGPEIKKRAEEIVNAANQHQYCATQLQYLANRAEELSSLLAGMTTERDDTAALAAKAGGMVTKLSAENKRLREALRQIVAYGDDGANMVLRKTGSYSGFDEPGAVQIARETLAALNHAEQGEGS